VYAVLTVVGIAVVMILLTKNAIKQAQEDSGWTNAQATVEEKKPAIEQLKFYLKNFPLKDKRFMFFIFILIPVQTLLRTTGLPCRSTSAAHSLAS